MVLGRYSIVLNLVLLGVEVFNRQTSENWPHIKNCCRLYATSQNANARQGDDGD